MGLKENEKRPCQLCDQQMGICGWASPRQYGAQHDTSSLGKAWSYWCVSIYESRQILQSTTHLWDTKLELALLLGDVLQKNVMCLQMPGQWGLGSGDWAVSPIDAHPSEDKEATELHSLMFSTWANLHLGLRCRCEFEDCLGEDERWLCTRACALHLGGDLSSQQSLSGHRNLPMAQSHWKRV